ncbi:hypothetical protein LTR84_008998 [Exophiala bonariae]|uniref:Major facilitator superfamily (MFS) profile domain-containing protein n=1 Tax=Exophiala bonariae TaxID=1690606 RepID=A0AAV9MVD8_9EURO|nr:hypothetical protein LTR84_008998 [Exophiala bonariae]
MKGAEIEATAVPSGGEGVKVHMKTWIVLACVNFVSFAQIVAIVGSGLLASAIAGVVGGADKTLWFTQTINILTIAIALPVSQIADYWGRKWILTVLTLLGCIGSILVARALNVGYVIAGFTLVGMNVGTQPVLYAVASEILPRKHRGWAIMSTNISVSIGGLLALLTGGALLKDGEIDRFRDYFYIVVAFYGVAFLGCLFCYHPPPRELQVSLTFPEKLRKLDWIGYALFAPGLTLLSVALSWSQNPYPWSNVHIIATFIIGVVMLIAFGIYEWRFKKDGIFHHDLFQNRNFPIALVAVWVDGLSFFTANTYFAMQYSIFTGSNLLLSAAAFSMIFIVGTLASVGFGAFVAIFKSVKALGIAGLALIVLFNVLMATTTPSTPAANYWGYVVFAGIGLAGVIPSFMLVAQMSTPSHLISLASGLDIVSRPVGGVIGLAVNTAIFNSAMTEQVPAKIAAATLPLGLPATSLPGLILALMARDDAALAAIPGATPDIIQAAGGGLMSAYHIAFRNCWITAAALCVPGVIIACFLKGFESEFKPHIDAPVEAELVEIQKRVETHHLEGKLPQHDEKSQTSSNRRA